MLDSKGAEKKARSLHNSVKDGHNFSFSSKLKKGLFTVETIAPLYESPVPAKTERRALKAFTGAMRPLPSRALI